MPSSRFHRLDNTRKVGPPGNEGVLSVAQQPQARGCLWQLDGVLVQTQQAASRLEGGEQPLRMAAVAECGVHSALSRLRSQCREDFLDHDRHMLSGGRFSAGQHFGDGICVHFRVQFLVFLLKVTGVSAAIPGAAWRSQVGGVFSHHNSLYLALEPRAFSTG